MVHQSGGEWVTKLLRKISLIKTFNNYQLEKPFFFFEILKGYINFADLASKTRDQEIIKYFISP